MDKPDVNNFAWYYDSNDNVLHRIVTPLSENPPVPISSLEGQLLDIDVWETKIDDPEIHPSEVNEALASENPTENKILYIQLKLQATTSRYSFIYTLFPDHLDPSHTSDQNVLDIFKKINDRFEAKKIKKIDIPFSYNGCYGVPRILD